LNELQVVCEIHNEQLKNMILLGLDAASPLFRTNHLKEKHKKLDREDARLVDVIHTDASPVLFFPLSLKQERLSS
jgi:CMP-N-acetylneuraminic acid synthetase